MKKKNLKNLQLRKKSISNLENRTLKGGNTYDSRLICPGPDTEGSDCQTAGNTCNSKFTDCFC